MHGGLRAIGALTEATYTETELKSHQPRSIGRVIRSRWTPRPEPICTRPRDNIQKGTPSRQRDQASVLKDFVGRRWTHTLPPTDRQALVDSDPASFEDAITQRKDLAGVRKGVLPGAMLAHEGRGTERCGGGHPLGDGISKPKRTRIAINNSFHSSTTRLLAMAKARRSPFGMLMYTGRLQQFKRREPNSLGRER